MLRDDRVDCLNIRSPTNIVPTTHVRFRPAAAQAPVGRHVRQSLRGPTRLLHCVAEQQSVPLASTQTFHSSAAAIELVESDRLDPPIFSPATKAETGHDENVTIDHVRNALGDELTATLQSRSMALYLAGRDRAAQNGIIIADTKFEFGHTKDGELLLIDELLTPDSSRFWQAAEYEPGRGQSSFDKQPLRDYLAELRRAGTWDAEPPPPPLSADTVRVTSDRYLDAYKRITGTPLAIAS